MTQYKYHIIGVYQGNSEILDGCDTLSEANYLVGKYRVAFRATWRIYREVNEDYEESEE